MDVSVLIGTYGDIRWKRLAMQRAMPSGRYQSPRPLEVLRRHEMSVPGKHHVDLTISAVRNRLAAEAKGNWLCFLDGDDELAAGYLVAMAQAWVAYGCAPGEVKTESGPRPTRIGPTVPPPLLVPRVVYVHPDGREEEPVFPNRGRWPDLNVAVIGTLVPRPLFEQVGGFRVGYEPYEDYELWLRCVRAGARLVEVPDAIYIAHVDPESAHRNEAGRQHRVELHRRILAEHRA